MVKVRFAPSPTGGLHVGSIKTALINYLFAKSNGGQFLLRVEDTDKERSTKEYVNNIEEGLNLLGLVHDGKVFYQSSNLDRHVEVANKLLQLNKAYKCYATPSEIEEFKLQNPSKKFVSKWSAEGAKPVEDAPYVVRLRAPHSGTTVVEDMVQGRVEVANEELDDMVLLRSDGTPTYMLAVVVDDFDMEITHVIRGNDHFTNTFRQLQIFHAMDWSVPKFMHIPLMHGADGHKLSKRHGATTLGDLLDRGYLIEAVINYLLLLGVGFEEPEIFSIEHAIGHFKYNKISKSPARFDYAKLRFVNSQHINALEDKKILDYLHSHITDLSAEILLRIEAGVPLIKERAELMTDTIALAMLFKEKFEPEDEKSRQVLGELSSFVPKLSEFLLSIPFEGKDSLKNALKEFAKNCGLKFPQIMQLLRAAVLGTFASPGIIDMMLILGKEEVLKRIG